MHVRRRASLPPLPLTTNHPNDARQRELPQPQCPLSPHRPNTQHVYPTRQKQTHLEDKIFAIKNNIAGCATLWGLYCRMQLNNLILSSFISGAYVGPSNHYHRVLYSAGGVLPYAGVLSYVVQYTVCLTSDHRSVPHRGSIRYIHLSHQRCARRHPGILGYHGSVLRQWH